MNPTPLIEITARAVALAFRAIQYIATAAFCLLIGAAFALAF